MESIISTESSFKQRALVDEIFVYVDFIKKFIL